MNEAPHDHSHAFRFTQEDQRILDRVEKYLSNALALKRWWEGTETSQSSRKEFVLERTFNRAERSYGFFGEATLDGHATPVMGNVQEMLYDRAKVPPQEKQAGVQRLQEQLREFVLHYFMRISSFRQPEVITSGDACDHPRFLQRLSWCPTHHAVREGFGFSQLYYKTVKGDIGKFSDQSAIIDLREIGSKYAWIVLKVRIFDFAFKTRPFGDQRLQLVFDLDEESYLVVTSDFILDRTRPEPGIAGQYGFGYGFIKSPEPSFLAYGPGEFDAAYELIDFRLRDSGDITIHMVFVVNQPTRVANVDINPVGWSLSLVDVVSLGTASAFLGPLRKAVRRFPFHLGTIDPISAYISILETATQGKAAERLCISRETLDKAFLLQHFMQHYQTAVGSLQTWRQIEDWLDTDKLPGWVVTGKSS